MSTKTTDRLSSADLAARLRERQEAYRLAVAHERRMHADFRAALRDLDISERMLDRDHREWDERIRAAGLMEPMAVAVSGSPAMHLGDAQRRLGDVLLCGVKTTSATLATGSMAADCPACLAALDEVQP
jgi:hypothetical protein